MKLKSTLSWVAVCCLAFAGQASAHDYNVKQMPNLPEWPNLLPTDINNNGNVTGIGFAGFGWVTRAFYYDGQETHDFSKPLIEAVPPQYPFVGTRGLRINDHNHILLNLEVVDLGVFSFVWDGQDFHHFDPPGLPQGAEPAAAAINNHGVLAGSYKLITPNWELIYRAIVWDPANPRTTVVIDPPHPWTDSGAFDISDAGWVTGMLSGGPLPARGFLWRNGVMTVLKPIDRQDYLAISQRVNDAGIAGAFTTNQPPPGQPSLSRLIVWSTIGVHHVAMPLPGLTGFQVYGINNGNEVVGTMYGPQQPFHFHNGVLRNLNNHIPAALSLDLWDAEGINDKGQIVANGQYIGTGDFNNYGFILTPRQPANDDREDRP